MAFVYTQLYNHWQALIISIAMAYYFRLPSRGEALIVTSAGKPVAEKYDRTSFVNNMNRMLAQNDWPEGLLFKHTLQGLLAAFYEQTQIPGIIIPYF